MTYLIARSRVCQPRVRVFGAQGAVRNVYRGWGKVVQPSSWTASRAMRLACGQADVSRRVTAPEAPRRHRSHKALPISWPQHRTRGSFSRGRPPRGRPPPVSATTVTLRPLGDVNAKPVAPSTHVGATASRSEPERWLFLCAHCACPAQRTLSREWCQACCFSASPPGNSRVPRKMALAAT